MSQGSPTVVDRTAQAAAMVPAGDRGLYLSKGRLDALSCDGRFVDQQERPFVYSTAVVRGTLAHVAGADARRPGGSARQG